MIEYVDPIPPIIRMLKPFFEERIYGNTFPSNAPLPSILVRTAGGTDYTRLQLVVRANYDVDAMQLLIKVMNTIFTNFSLIIGLRVMWVEKESNPILMIDQDTGKPEAWAYVRLEHLEA